MPWTLSLPKRAAAEAPHPEPSPPAPKPWALSTDSKTAEERKAHGGYTLLELEEVSSDPEKWARLHGWIPDRVTKDPVRFNPSPLQRRMFSYYAWCHRLKIPCREVAVKIRRGGGSTGLEIILHVHVHNNQARVGAIGTTDTVSMNMFEMARFLAKHDDYPGWDAKPTKILETGEIEWPNGSSWEKYTADNPEAARSAGLQGYHATEIGRWQDGGAKDAKETLKSMLGAVPRRGFTFVGEESTAQGATGALYNRFMAARWPTAEELGVKEGQEYWRQWEDETPQNVERSESTRYLQFVRVFAAWFEDDENRPEHGVSEEEIAYLKATLDEKELALIKRYRNFGVQGERLGREAKRATLWEQLAWRRSVLHGSEFEGDEGAFEQENPSSPKEAFASSGRHTFNRAGCAWMKAITRTPEVGILTRQPDGGVVFQRTEIGQAWFYMWEPPKEGMRYIAGLDTAGGANNVKDPNRADYHAGGVLRAPHVETETGIRRPVREVASLLPRCQWDPDMLASKMQLVSDFYGRCLVVFERNNTGFAFLGFAKLLGLNLYREQYVDRVTSETKEILGWYTDDKTRPQLIAMLKQHIRNNAQADTRNQGLECWSEVAVQQLTDMILDTDGVDRAPGSKHDDEVMWLGMALCCLNGATYFAARKRRRSGPPDRDAWRQSRT